MSAKRLHLFSSESRSTSGATKTQRPATTRSRSSSRAWMPAWPTSPSQRWLRRRILRQRKRRTRPLEPNSRRYDQVAAERGRAEAILAAKTAEEAVALSLPDDDRERIEALIKEARSAVRRVKGAVSMVLPFYLRGEEMP
jgi:hypothetical protein